MMAFEIDGDDEAVEPCLADQSFDFFLAAAEMVFVAVFRQEGEAGKVAEAVVGDADNLTGVVLLVMGAWRMCRTGVSWNAAVRRRKNCARDTAEAFDATRN